MTSVSQYAFYDCTSLRNVTIPSSITSIGNYAFTNCTNLSNVNIGGTLTSIGAGAFRNCPLITSFDFKKGLTTIGYGAFAGTGLSNASLPISLTSLSTYSLGYDYKNGDYTKKDTFTMSGYSGEAMNYATKNGFDFTNLLEYKTTDDDSGISIVKYKGKDTEFEIPEEIDGKPVVSIEKNAFNGNVTLKKVILPESMTSVPAYSFYGCCGLEEVVLSDSIKSIQTYAFEFCDKLTTINLDETPLKTIGLGAFWGCKALEEVSLPAGLENICDYAFCNSGLYSIMLPGTIKYMGDHALGYNYKDSEYIKISTFKIYGYNGKASEYAKNNSITFYEIPDSELYNYQVNSDSSLVITHYNGSGLNVTVPETINGNTLYSLGSEAFFNNKYITSVTVPGVVTNWGDYVFGNCELLTSAAISDGCKDLGYSTFTGCTSLESVYLSNDLTSVPDYTFAGCTSLKSVNIPSNAEFIGNGAFNGCISLESIVFPEGISKIYSYAFFGCTSLKSIALPKDLKTIDQSAFSGCSGLTNVEIPEGVTEIDDSAFGFCGLESVSIPASVTWIGDYAFEGNEGMTIYGVTGSAAETYANNNGFTFVGKSSEPLANKSTISSENINLGKKVTLTAIAEGGSEPYTYAFMYRQSGTSSWKTLGTKYGTESVKTFKPTATGAYDILITVKDSSGKTVSKKFTLNVTSVLVNISSVSSVDVFCGAKVTITGMAEGGTAPYYFTYQIMKPGKTTWTTLGVKYGTAESKVFNAKLSGQYKVRVLVKDSAGTVKSYSETVYSTGTLLVNKSTISTTKTKVGNKVTLTAVPEGGTEPYRYTYEYKKPGETKFKTIGKRGTTYKSVSFTPDTAGTYEARVYIQDESDYVTVKNFKVTVT